MRKNLHPIFSSNLDKLSETSKGQAANSAERQACRSLLQKAVRRGDEKTIKIASKYLESVGDLSWFKQRAMVIIFEECWHLTATLPPVLTASSALSALITASKIVKQKDATGLGTLALAYSQGDTSVIKTKEILRHIRIVAEGIRRPKDFWIWVKSCCVNNDQSAVVQSAYNAFRHGGWTWDLAFMQAAAYLSVIDKIPMSKEVSQTTSEIPIWIALDRHTSDGRNMLRSISIQKNISFAQILWINFYFESAVTNELWDSPWWTREIEWRLNSVGLNVLTGEKLWSQVRPMFIDLIAERASRLEKSLLEPPITQSGLF